MTVRLAAVVAVALVATGCRRERPGVPVGQADDTPYVLPSLDAFAADTLAAGDSLALRPPDSLAADSVRADAPADVAPAWAAVQAAVRTRREDAWRALAGDGADAARAWEWLAAETPAGEAFRAGLLALSPRELARDGTARTARVVVGFDAAGRVVPQDEAETDRTLAVRLDVAGGAYRVVAVEAP